MPEFSSAFRPNRSRLTRSEAQIARNAEALAMTRLKFEFPQWILWPAIGLFAELFAHYGTAAALFAGATLHPSVAAFIVKEWLTSPGDFELPVTGCRPNSLISPVHSLPLSRLVFGLPVPAGSLRLNL